MFRGVRSLLSVTSVSSVECFTISRGRGQAPVETCNGVCVLVCALFSLHCRYWRPCLFLCAECVCYQWTPTCYSIPTSSHHEVHPPPTHTHTHTCTHTAAVWWVDVRVYSCSCTTTLKPLVLCGPLHSEKALVFHSSISSYWHCQGTSGTFFIASTSLFLSCLPPDAPPPSMRCYWCSQQWPVLLVGSSLH